MKLRTLMKTTDASTGLSQRLNRMIAGGSLDYYSWRSLILEIEKAYPEDINTLSLAYEAFLSKFPLCNWHLEKYAYKKAKLCSSQEAVIIYDKLAEIAMFSVGFWVDYFTFAASCFGDHEDVRRLFGRAISFVGKDYFCHVLWDRYMKYEFNLEGWSFLAQSYIQVLRFPTKKLQFYYDNFKQFVANLKEEMGCDNNSVNEEHVSHPRIAIDLSKDEISLVIKDMLHSSDGSLKSKALEKYRSIGEEFYLGACKMDEKVKRFESKIRRRYFDASPLDNDQLNNWHLYLDFVEKEDNMDWAMKLYERCLIPCATYPEFWMRYVEFLESKGGRELAVSALARATQIFLKDVSEIHLFDSRFKEHIGDVNGARAALVLCDTKTDSALIGNVATQANLERRLGNFAAASATYEKALKEARERQKLHLIPTLYSRSAHLTFLMTGSASAARDKLIDGIREVPHCIILLEELIKFVMIHEGATHVNIIDPIIADAISPGLDEYEGLNANDRENLSRLFLEFVDLCGTTNDIRKAWKRHVKLFPESMRIKAPFMHSMRGNYTVDLVDRNDKQDHDVPVHNGALDFPVNNEVHPHQVVEKLSLQKDNTTNGKEMIVVSSNDDESRGNEMACEITFKSKEEQLHPMVGSAELSDPDKQKALVLLDSDPDVLYRSGGNEPGPMDVCADTGMLSEEKVLSPHEVGKSTETTEPIEASHLSLISVQPELDNELKQARRPVSFGNVPIKSKEKEPQAIRSVESPQIGSESERDGSTSRPHIDKSSRTDRDHMVLPLKSGSKEHALVHESVLEQSSYHDHHPAVTNHSNGLQNSDKETSGMTLSNGMSVGQQPVSSHPVSYPQQNTNVTGPLSDQHPWQGQGSLSMNQMLQYHYNQQQQLLQQQYQQQLHMQNTYFQMQQQYMNQQPYPQYQQHYVQQQPLTYQQSTSFDQSQQHQQQTQQMQGQEPRSNNQLGQSECRQSQDLTYQAYQLAYQQQYQQYQGYQQHHVNQHPSQKQEDEIAQQHHQQFQPKHSLASMGQNRKGSKTATPDYEGAAKSSESSHLQSPQVYH